MQNFFVFLKKIPLMKKRRPSLGASFNLLLLQHRPIRISLQKDCPESFYFVPRESRFRTLFSFHGQYLKKEKEKSGINERMRLTRKQLFR